MTFTKRRELTTKVTRAGRFLCAIKHLPEQMPLTIVTNSMRVADALRERQWIETYLIGGRVKPSGNINDVLSTEFIRLFKFDVSFVTGGGISEEGIFVAIPEVGVFVPYLLHPAAAPEYWQVCQEVVIGTRTDNRAFNALERESLAKAFFNREPCVFVNFSTAESSNEQCKMKPNLEIFNSSSIELNTLLECNE